MKHSKAVWFSPFRYAAPADLEQYFEQMEKQGWHIHRLTQWNSLRLKFQRSSPHRYKYVVDLQPFPKSDYVSTYQSFGWELVGKMASMHVWRMPYTHQKPEAFTDPQSIHKRNDTFSIVMLALAICMAAAIAAVAIWFFAAGGWKTADGVVGFAITVVILGALIAVLLYSRNKVTANRNR